MRGNRDDISKYVHEIYSFYFYYFSCVVAATRVRSYGQSVSTIAAGAGVL